jgi:hypothetical protein
MSDFKQVFVRKLRPNLIRKIGSSPRFVESDPHFGLLTRTVQYLDREMRGNYRNLICVRYEDLKICSRQYSSEAFNLVRFEAATKASFFISPLGT